MDPIRHLDLRLLDQFLIVCDTLSMTVAAERLGMSVPAVSQLVLRIERDLRISLFERSRQGLRLTPAGAKLRERARLLLDSERDTLDTLTGYRDKLIPQLRLHVLLSVATPLMPAIVSEFGDSVGKIDLRSGQNNNYVKEFLGGDLDLLITSEEMSDVPGIEQHFLCEENLVGIVPTTIPESQRQLEYLTEHLSFVRFMRGHARHQMVEDYLVEVGLDPPHNIECGSPGPILELVSRGLGWAITTPLSVSSLNPSIEKVAWMKLPGAVPSRKIFLLAHAGRYLDLPQRLAERCRAALSDAVHEWQTLFGNDVLGASVRVAPPTAARAAKGNAALR